jgi:hypothetical protein
MMSLGVPWRAAVAQAVDSDASRAGAETWFREYIEPNLNAAEERERSEGLSVPLERPREVAPKKSTQRHLGELGPLGMLVLDVDVPQTRGDWNDALQPKMFRLYFEPIPSPAAPSPRSRAAGA